jgi:hypothetical protein
VGGGDGADDGQAKAVASIAAGGARAEPLEGLEQPVDLGGRDDRPGAGHRQDGAVSARFPGSQAGGDSQVTFPVTVLSPPLPYNWTHDPFRGF